MGYTLFPHCVLVRDLADLRMKTQACQKPTEQILLLISFTTHAFKKTLLLSLSPPPHPPLSSIGLAN